MSSVLRNEMLKEKERLVLQVHLLLPLQFLLLSW
jgi:hypothetical protein